ncbi:hypothetical protein [Streptomyces sp. NPDC048710]|uniref:hypothetical protein n=1 Tax=Streptomyces sp. NPDC048710 TaxID=3365586 RepID=UPI003719CF64
MSMPPVPQSTNQTPLYPWGVPQGPPEKSRVGLMVGIIGGVFLLIVALLATLVLVGKKIDSSYPRAESTLTAPGTLLDGHYKLAKDDSPRLGPPLEKSWRLSWEAKAVHGVVVAYHPSGGDRGDLVVTGMYGRFRNTAAVRSRVLAGNGSQHTEVKVIVPPMDVTPSGSRTRVSCEEVTRSWTDGKTLSYPVCAWADGNTWARVAYMTVYTARSLSLESAARITLQIRSEMVKPIR